MIEHECRMTASDRIRWWLYDRCFAYCVRCVHPDADPAEFSIIDNASFVAISKDEIAELIEESPDSAWRFGVEIAS